MASRRVLLVIGQLGGGGAERQLVNFLRHAGAAVEVHALVLHPRDIWMDELRELASELSISRFRSPLLRIVEFLEVLRDARPEIVHCWHTFPVVYAALSKPIHRVPVVVNIRGDITRDPRTAEPRRYGYTRFLRWADVAVSNSRHSLNRLEEARVRLPRTEVIPNGIELPPRAPRPAASSTFRVIGIGSLKPLKNWTQLLESCAALAREGHAVAPKILGEGDQRAELEELCRRLGFDPRLVLPGFSTHPGEALASADLLVHCSLSEGMPNAVLEGLAAGLPVLASDLDICRELAGQGEGIELFPVGDDAACSRALGGLMRDPQRRAAMGSGGRELVRTRFTGAAMARRYLELYEELLAR